MEREERRRNRYSNSDDSELLAWKDNSLLAWKDNSGIMITSRYCSKMYSISIFSVVINGNETLYERRDKNGGAKR